MLRTALVLVTAALAASLLWQANRAAGQGSKEERQPAAEDTMSIDIKRGPAPIDLRQPQQIETATFALG
jgi:uncharacterized membrane-anchored protein